MRYSLQGLVLGPVLVALIVALKAFCDEGEACFADRFAGPIFLPLTSLYKILGGTAIGSGQEFLFIMAYWAFVGFLIGFIIDLLGAKEMPKPTNPDPIVKVEPQPPMPVPHTLAPKPKLPINILDRKEEDWPSA